MRDFGPLCEEKAAWVTGLLLVEVCALVRDFGPLCEEKAAWVTGLLRV